MRNMDMPFLRNAVAGRKRLVLLTTAAALSVLLIAAAVVSATAVLGESKRKAPVPSSGSLPPAASLAKAARYVHISDGRFTLDIPSAEKAGVSSQALNAESSIVTGMNEPVGGETATASSARDSSAAADVAGAVPASAQDTTYTVLPGITLSISSTGVTLSLTAEAVSEIQNLAGFGEHVSDLVGSVLVLALIAVPDGSDIAAGVTGIVSAAIGFGSVFLSACTASNGSAAFNVPWPWLWLSLDLPSCSGISI